MTTMTVYQTRANGLVENTHEIEIDATKPAEDQVKKWFCWDWDYQASDDSDTFALCAIKDGFQVYRCESEDVILNDDDGSVAVNLSGLRGAERIIETR